MCDHTTCTICLCEGCDEVLPCGHGFHAKCLVPWLWKNASCPLCRSTNDDHGGELYMQEDDRGSQTLNEIMEHIRREQDQRTQAIRKTIRQIKRGNCEHLNAALQTRVKLRATLDACRTNQRDAHKVLVSHDRRIAKKRKDLYAEYKRMHNEQEREHKRSIRNDVRRYEALQRKMNRLTTHIMAIDDMFVEHSAPPV